TKENISNDFFVLGNEYYQLEKYTEASTQFQQAILYNSKNKNAYINLIHCYQQLGKYEQAFKLIVEQYKPKVAQYNQNLLKLLGNNYFIQKDYENTIDIFNEYIKLYPDDHIGYYNLALAYLNNEQSDQAITYFLKCYELNEKFVPNLYNIAFYYYQSKNYQESFYYFHQVINLEQNNSIIYQQLARLEYELEEYEDALTHFLKAIELDEDRTDYYIWVARVYAKAYNNKKRTLEYIEKALDKGYKNTDSLLAIEEFSTLKKLDEFNDLLKKYIKK
ncbi:MAG: tetratricopeptide repeat protein, partial [Spirochaetes bacterium]|nr:tetratricopeptide repeat protein [Spirochaetota bacterium]